MPKKPPNPGSKEAQELGCTCPVLDNAHGKGYMLQPNVFVYNCACPVHAYKPKEKKNGN